MDGRQERIPPYFERAFGKMAVKIAPGEYYVTSGDTMIVTVLGSCVSVCIRDRYSGMGGMNHFMLPLSVLGSPPSARYGEHAMDILVDSLLAAGCRLEDLEAKVFGAGRVLGAVTDIGRRNAEFALQYLAERKIHVTAYDVGDVHPRKICFEPETGKVFVRQLRQPVDS